MYEEYDAYDYEEAKRQREEELQWQPTAEELIELLQG